MKKPCETHRLREMLEKIMPKESVVDWLWTPNEDFSGHMPLVIFLSEGLEPFEKMATEESCA